MTDYSFTIIVPLYNSAIFLDKCIKSLQGQSYNNFEIILVDDGSQDDTLALCTSYAQRDSRVRVYTKKNEGQGVARNYGLARANNDFILYVDSDDYIEENTLLKVNNLINQEPDCDIVNFLIDFVDSHNKTHHQASKFSMSTMEGEDIFISAMLDRDILSSPCNKAYRRTFLVNNGILFPALRKNEDILYSRIVGFHAQKATFINETFYHALIRSGSTSRDFTSHNLKDSLSTINKLKEFLLEKRMMEKHEFVYKAFIVRHLSYLLIISAFRTNTYEDFKDKVTLTSDFGLNDYLKDRKVLNLLSYKQKIMAVLCRVPLFLYSIAKLSTKSGLYNPGR